MLTSLINAAIGKEITRLGISFFPVYVNQVAPLIASGVGAGVRITERADAQVPTLTITNDSGVWTLVPAGTLVAGGHQNRTLNVSVLVPAHTTIDVPVSCVESGRWNGGHGFVVGDMFAPRRVRRAMQRTFHDNLRTSGERHADQGAVWSSIGDELHRLGAENATNDLFAAREALLRDERRQAVIDDLVARGPLPGQVGVVVSHGSRVVAADLFATPDMLACHWGALVRSHLLEAVDQPRSKPSATKVLDFLRRFAAAPAEVTAGAGAGREHHVHTSRIAGQALLLDGVVVHASMFAVAA